MEGQNLTNKFLWNLNQNEQVFFQENVFKLFFVLAILFRLQYVNEIEFQWRMVLHLWFQAIIWINIDSIFMRMHGTSFIKNPFKFQMLKKRGNALEVMMFRFHIHFGSGGDELAFVLLYQICFDNLHKYYVTLMTLWLEMPWHHHQAWCFLPGNEDVIAICKPWW